MQSDFSQWTKITIFRGVSALPDLPIPDRKSVVLGLVHSSTKKNRRRAVQPPTVTLSLDCTDDHPPLRTSLLNASSPLRRICYGQIMIGFPVSFNGLLVQSLSELESMLTSGYGSDIACIPTQASRVSPGTNATTLMRAEKVTVCPTARDSGAPFSLTRPS